MEGRHIYAFAAIQVAAAGALVWVLVTVASPWNLQRCVGTVLVVLGGTFIAIARYQLGKSFSFRPEAHQLVTLGVYSKIRNPIYVFGAIMVAGLILVLQRPALWLVLIVVVVAQTIRARREAHVLEAAFGDAYREYRRKTWF